MDPIVEALQRMNPKDHSLDGMPVTVLVVGVVLLLSPPSPLVPANRDGRR